MSQTVKQLAGQKVEVDFGDIAYQLYFETDTSMTYKVVKGSDQGITETVNYRKVVIRPNIYFIYWQERDKTTVTHYEDFEKQIVHSNITLMDGTFMNLKGTLSMVD